MNLISRALATWAIVFGPAAVRICLAETFYYTGPSGGDFFTETNWNSAPDGSGNAPAIGSIEPSIGITHDLIVDGDSVLASGPDAFVLTVGDGGALSLLTGSELRVQDSQSSAVFEVTSLGTFSLVDSILEVDDDIILVGSSSFEGGTVQSFSDDIEFRGGPVTIVDTGFDIDDSIIFETDLTSSSGSSIAGATFVTNARIGIRAFDVTVTDTILNAAGDLEDVFATDLDTATGTLTLLGNSALTADQIQEGVRVRIDDFSTATLTNVTGLGETSWFSQSSTVTLDSEDARLTLVNSQIENATDRVFSGLSGTDFSYATHPHLFSPSTWNGTDAVTIIAIPEASSLSLLLVAILAIGQRPAHYRSNRAHALRHSSMLEILDFGNTRSVRWMIVFLIYGSVLSEGRVSIAETFYYTGPSGGDFFTESNWNSNPVGGGTSPAAGTIEPNIGYVHDLIIDGDFVMASGTNAFVLDIAEGGGLSLLAGSELQVTALSANAQFEVSSGAIFSLTDATLGVDDDIFLRGTSTFTGGELETFADDLEIRTEDMQNALNISGTTFNVDDSLIFEAELTPEAGNVVTNATFDSILRIGIRHFNVTVVDTVLNASGDLENVFTTDLDDATATLTLLGNSALTADQVQEGVTLRVGDSSTATLTNVVEFIQEPTWFSQSSTVILDSPDAQLILTNPQSDVFDADFDHDVDVDGRDFLIWQRGFGKTGQTDNSMGDADGTGTVDVEDLRDWRARYQTKNARFKVINGLTGKSYAEDPSTWNITDWNGIDPVTLSIIGPPELSAVPEPTSAMLAVIGVVCALGRRSRCDE